jgi:4-oxalocrotonate tautomerase
MIILQVYLIAGRTVEQKERLVEALTKAAAASLGLEYMAVQIVIKDLPNTDFGLAGKTAKSLGRGIGRAEMLDNR